MNRSTFVVAGWGMALLAGCGHAPSLPPTGPVPVMGHAVPGTADAGLIAPAPYLLATGDELDIKVPDAPQYDQTARVRPDGKVALQVVGTVHVAGRSPDDVQSEVRERYRQAGGGLQQREYLLHPNDELDIKFPYQAQLNETLRVRPDGKLQLQLVGTVQAEGLTPEQLQAELKRRYAKVLRVPELSVILRTATSQSLRTNAGTGRAGVNSLEPTVLVRNFQAPQVYVAGEMARPGMFAFTPGMTLLQALAQAGGHLPTADLERLIVLRRTGAGAAEVLQPGLERDYLGAPRKDLVLQPFDVVMLPPSRVALLGQDLEQYVFKILPPLRNSSFGFVYDIRKNGN